jgi:transposase-like protein
VSTEHGPVEVRTPRDRNASFEPQIVRKGQRPFQGFDDKILALYSRGLSTRDIDAHLAEIYGVKVGRDLISRVTDAVMDDVREWQQRPLDEVYPVIFLDALVLKIREGGTVQRRACYLALGVTVEGERDVLGMWFQETEGAKFWMQILSELKQRGVNDILVCCVDGLKGFPEAIEAIYPHTVVQTCVVHLIRHSLKYVPRREREQVARDLKPIYTAADAARAALEDFDDKWGARFPVITQAWLNAWEYVTPFLAFPPELRRVVRPAKPYFMLTASTESSAVPSIRDRAASVSPARICPKTSTNTGNRSAWRLPCATSWCRSRNRPSSCAPVGCSGVRAARAAAAASMRSFASSRSRAKKPGRPAPFSTICWNFCSSAFVSAPS